MITWQVDTVLVLAVGAMLITSLCVIGRRVLRRISRREEPDRISVMGKPEIVTVSDSFRKTNNQFFSWEDHPTLVREASDYGWPRFAFTTTTSSSSFGHGGGAGENGGWELNKGSADDIQRIRLNPGTRTKVFPGRSPLPGAVSVTRAALPLPGPQWGNALFPEEAYFEITILPGEDDANNEGDGDKEMNGKLDEEDLERKPGPDEVLLCIGLTGGGSFSPPFPGDYHGSIGFDSTGSVFVNGNKLLSSWNGRWGRYGQVIGCGYNPGQRRVFFTVDSELVHKIHCSSEEFGHPLYPAFASNAGATALVNFGQRPFKYPPGNMSRIPNPCLFQTSASLDSEDYFSIGRINSHWRQLSSVRMNSSVASGTKSSEAFDPESESDRFEIVLDFSGSSRSARGPR